MYCCTGLQPVPPYSFGQCETPQPFLLRMRHQVTISSLDRCRPSCSLRRVSGGTLSRKNARTSSRNAISSLVKARSIGSSCEKNELLRDLLLCGRVLLAQFVARELSDRRARQFLDEFDLHRQLMLAELSGEKRAQLVDRELRLAGPQRDEGFRRLAAVSVGDADHDHL